MATKLDDISVEIGGLKEGQRQAENSRADHARTTQAQFTRVADQFEKVSTQLEKVNVRLDAIASTIDLKVEKATNKILHGSIGGAAIVGLQYAASLMGFKLPGGQ